MLRSYVLILGCAWNILTLQAMDNHVGYENAQPDDKTISAASELKLDIPVHCREFHIWWTAPFGASPHPNTWQHWKGERRYGEFHPLKSLVNLRPGSSWRRYLNAPGYPLFGPYDSGQDEIIRWQLRTAKAAGLESLNLHIWSSLHDDGVDFGPLPIIEKVLDIAAEEDFPVGIYDQIQFRGPKTGAAQTLENSIRRATAFLKRYGEHPGWYKVDGLPFYYFNNWNNWITPQDMQQWFSEVEKEVGPVFWVVEMAMNNDVLKIPQLRMYASHSFAEFYQSPPDYGMGNHDWEGVRAKLEKWIKKAKDAGKLTTLHIKGRFNNSFDRGQPGRWILPADDGLTLVRMMKEARDAGIDSLTLSQWNDFEEGAFLEPAWDFDGFNGDPYRYCRIIAASVGQTFSPAPLPARENVDPYMRRKLYGDSQPGDLGPVMYDLKMSGNRLSWKWAEGSSEPVALLVSHDLVQWNNTNITYHKEPVRLGNFASFPDGTIIGNAEMRFYLPGLIGKKGPFWLAVRHTLGEETNLNLEYRSSPAKARINSGWRMSSCNERSGLSTFLNDSDGSTLSWFPISHAAFNGLEGDLTITLKRSRKASTIHQLAVYTPELSTQRIPLDRQATTFDLTDTQLTQPLVVTPVDHLGNAGLPRMIWQGMAFPELEPESLDYASHLNH